MPFHVGPDPAVASASHERRVALVIGNTAYRHSSELANPVNDAEAIAAVLGRLGFDVVKGLNLDLRKMGDVQEAFEEKLRSKPDIALLYYPGHGLQVKGFNYLVPIDAQIDAPAHLSTRAVRFNDIFDPMAEEAGASLIFLDACRDNPFTRNLARSLGEGARSTSIRGGLARVEKVAGTFIAYATAPDTLAFDGKGANSPFTAALLKHIETPGLSVADVMIDVRNSVLEETKGRQEPWDQSSLRARFCFVPKIKEPKTEEPVKPLLQKPVKQPQISPSANEWFAIQHTTSLAVLARFKEHHPEPPWCDYADARADELRAANEARRNATEAERPKKIEDSTASQATSAIMDEIASVTLKPSALDDKVSAPKAKAVEPQTGAATTHDTGAAGRGRRMFYLVAGILLVVFMLALLLNAEYQPNRFDSSARLDPGDTEATSAPLVLPDPEAMSAPVIGDPEATSFPPIADPAATSAPVIGDPANLYCDNFFAILGNADANSKKFSETMNKLCREAMKSNNATIGGQITAEELECVGLACN